jgi:accessory gene regulator protein AgrB
MIEKIKNILFLLIITVIVFDGINDIMSNLLKDSVIINAISKPEITYKVIKRDTIWFYKFNR